MIISASRRTDIPAFYSTWFMNRVRAGYCTVPNPHNRRQVSRIDLRPSAVDVIVFWTRNARPLLAKLDELDARGYRYYVQYTILDNPRTLDAQTPRVDAAVATFQRLADRIGPDRVIWRYDPIVLAPATDAAYHRTRYASIAARLRGYTTRSVISVVDLYRKAARRLAAQGAAVAAQTVAEQPEFASLIASLVESATQHGMAITSCAEEIDLVRYGVQPGKCVDDTLIERVFGLHLACRKDSSQREACGCVASRDIGMYDTCQFGCQYCYATSSFARAAANYAAHNPLSPSLLGWYEHEAPDPAAAAPHGTVPA